MKERLYFRIPTDLRHKLNAHLEQGDTTLTLLMERYITQGLARDAGELVEQASVPFIRQVVREETDKAMTHLYERLSADLQKSARRSDDRLAALAVKAARSAGMGWRLAYAILAKVAGNDQASLAYEDAKEKVGREIARPDEPKAREPERRT